MKVTVIASGSAGNATLFSSGETRVLVDAGVGPRVLAKALRDAGDAGARPDAVVITHAHGDHVGKCELLARSFGVPVYMSEATARAIPLGHDVEVRRFGAREPFAVGALTLAPLPLPHDAAQVALVVGDGATKAAVVTDLGEVPPALPAHLAGCDVLLIEANHDVAMLEAGPYPYSLKRRILSARGHLSNAQTHALLRALPARAHTVVLMHLSRTNNRPDLALEAGHDALAGRRVRLRAAAQRGTFVIDVAAGPPDVPLPARAASARRGPPEQLSLPW